ncbi:hypothetical protein OROMI_021783 [Orobanche minor]
MAKILQLCTSRSSKLITLKLEAVVEFSGGKNSCI